MANMSYCRFENTLEDLRDCYDAGVDGLSEREQKAAKRLLVLCQRMVDAYSEQDISGELIEE